MLGAWVFLSLQDATPLVGTVEPGLKWADELGRLAQQVPNGVIVCGSKVLEAFHDGYCMGFRMRVPYFGVLT